MSKSAPRPWRLLALALAAILLAPTAGCLNLDFNGDPQDPPASDPPGSEDPPSDPPPSDPPPPTGASFVMPSDGSTVSAPTLIAVTGDGITSVRFSVDGVVAFNDTVSPFEWTLNPDSFGTGTHTIEARAETSAGEQSSSVRVNLQPMPSGPDQPQEVFDAVKSLAPGKWYEIPNTKLEAVAPVPRPAGIGNIVKAWSGGAFDTKRDRLIVWGGGHGDYNGNEIYVFDLGTLKWTRLTDPSAFWPGDPNNDAMRNYHPDGAPISRHSYGYIAYVPEPVDAFFVGGGAGLWSNGQWEDPSTYLFRFATMKWERLSDCPEAQIGAICSVGPDGRVWQSSGNYGASVYNPQTDAWTQWSAFDGWIGYSRAAAFDPVRNRHCVIGKGEFVYWDATQQVAPKRLSTTGDTGIQGASNPGFAYHPPSDRFVGWITGSDVYALDMSTLAWKRHATTGSVSPGSAPEQGTFGRFRYSPKQDLFVVVNGTDRNVFVYRLPNK